MKLMKNAKRKRKKKKRERGKEKEEKEKEACGLTSLQRTLQLLEADRERATSGGAT